MAKEPKDLNDEELAWIALQVRTRLINEFGRSRIERLLSTDSTIVTQLARFTYIEVREMLERKENGGAS